MDSLIRWTAKDRSKLNSAVNRFNSEVNKLSKMGLDVPDKKTFKEVLTHISTREEFANTLDTLNSLNQITGKETVSLASGEKVSLYKYNEISKRQDTAIKNLNIEIQKINDERLITGNKYMGEERITEIKETIDVISKYKDNAEMFEKTAKRINFIGRKDYEFQRNKLFRENFIKSLDNVKNFDHYKVLKEELNKYRNPSKFYEYVKKSNILMDIFVWYNSPDGYTRYGSFDSPNEMFDYALYDELEIKT